MDFADSIRKLAEKLPRLLEPCNGNEDATKLSLVLPFFLSLGYDIHDPDEVYPEPDASVRRRRNAKADYAIKKIGKPFLLVECKHTGVTLDEEHREQLDDYFRAMPEVRVSLLTNGVEFRFFTDLDSRNVMDVEPFLIFDLGIFDDNQINELKLFTKETFAIREIQSVAKRKKKQREEQDAQQKEQEHKAEISKLLTQYLRSPSEGFVTLIAKEIDPSVHLSQRRKKYFSRLVKEALRQSPDERVTSDLHDRRCEEPDFSKYRYWRQTVRNTGLLKLFMALHDYLVSLGKDVQANPTKYYISFKRSKTITYVKSQTVKNRLIVYVRADLEHTILQEGFTRVMPPGRHYPPCNVEIIIHNYEDLEKAKHLLQQSYQMS